MSEHLIFFNTMDIYKFTNLLSSQNICITIMLNNIIQSFVHHTSPCLQVLVDGVSLQWDNTDRLSYNASR